MHAHLLPLLSTLDTPELLLDYVQLQKNIRAMQEKADAHGLALRPHAKTHKCVNIATMQIEQGAVGLTCAKVDEALEFILGGISSITLAYPTLDARKLDKLLRAARENSVQIHLLADSHACVHALSQAAMRHNTSLSVFIKIDVGLGRCGLAPGNPEFIPLARAIHDNPHLELTGLISHAGHAYAAKNSAHVRDIMREEHNIMRTQAQNLRAAGLPVKHISVGDTPTALAARTKEDFHGLTELRPGNYVFLDRSTYRLNLAAPEQGALHVLASVVSANENYYIVDAGAKTLGLDLAPHGFGGPDFGYGLAHALQHSDASPMKVLKLSEEHGFLDRQSTPELTAGDRVIITPNHACAVANLAERYAVLKDERVDYWPVHARAKVR